MSSSESEEEKEFEGKLLQEVVEFNWEIDLDCFKDKKSGDKIFSPVFTTHTLDRKKNKNKWRLELYPSGISEECKSYLSLFLVNLSKTEINTNFSLSVLDQKNAKVDDNYDTDDYLFEDSDILSGGYNKFVERRFIMDPKNNIIQNNKFRILCKIRIKELSENKELVSQSAENVLKYKDIDRFELLLKNNEYSDVTIVAEGKSLHLHKCMLTTFSDVFEAMFRNDMKEKNQNIVKIEDVKYEVLQELFRFIYTGEVKKLDKMVMELFIAAEKYHIEHLKALCEETMVDNLTKDNAIDYLNFAITNDAQHLKADAIDWLSLRLESFILKPDFHEFGKQYPELLIEITQKSYSNLK